MEHIVSPWFIYLINIADSVNMLLGFISVSTMIAVFIYLFGVCLNSGLGQKEELEEWKQGWSPVKPVLWLFPVLMILTVAMPTKRVLIEMYIADKITTTTISKAIENGGKLRETIKKDILDILEKIEEDDN